MCILLWLYGWEVSTKMEKGLTHLGNFPVLRQPMRAVYYYSGSKTHFSLDLGEYRNDIADILVCESG